MINIIIPTYNCADYLIKTLVALESQTYKDFSVIVVDDGSTDNTQEMLDQYQRLSPPFAITKIKQEHAGSNTARNNGVKHATGEYLLFLDADKILKPNALEKFMETLDKSGKSYAYCNFVRDGHVHVSQPFSKDKLKSGELLIDCCALIRKQDFSKFDPRLKRLQDRDMFLSMLKSGKEGAWTKEVLFETKGRSGDITSTEDLKTASELIRMKHGGGKSLKGMVDIIILRFNTPKYDRDCVEAVLKNTKYPFYQITMFDNYYPRYVLSKIWNMLVSNSLGEYVVLLNNDTKPDPEWLNKMMEVLKREEKVGAVGPSTNQCRTPQKIGKKFKQYSVVDFEKEYKKVFQLSGYCLLFPKFVWTEVGGFDEKFGHYAQENEFLHRVQKAGYKTLWRKDAFVWHAGEASGKKLEKEEGFSIEKERQEGNVLYKKALEGKL